MDVIIVEKLEITVEDEGGEAVSLELSYSRDEDDLTFRVGDGGPFGGCWSTHLRPLFERALERWPVFPPAPDQG